MRSVVSRGRYAGAVVLAAALAASCTTELGAPRRDGGGGRADASTDAGSTDVDSGTATDGGPTLDSGPDAIDAGPPDAGPPPEIDAGPPPPTCPPPGPMDCSPGPGTGEGAECTLPPSCFLRTVQAAVRQVQADHPDWFDYSDGNPLVLQVEDYMNAVVALVNTAGYCCIRDPNAGDEIVVKFNNYAAENFDIYSSTGYARSGDPIYTSSCSPAWF